MQPLRGLKVLDLTRALAGPFCTMILGDLGARVDKVEPVGTGDMSRTWGPFDRGESTYFLCANRNKRSLALDFRKPQANDLLRRMVLQADIVVENFRPGVMQRMGLSFEDLRRDNPRLICISLSGFGSRGPYSDRAGFDQIAQGMSGLMSVTGPGDSAGYRVGIAVGDVVAGMWAAIGALAAVQARERTGEGTVVETSLLRGLLSIMGVQGQRYLSLHETGRAGGNSHPTIAPYGTYDCSDGPINLAPATASMWSTLCRVLDLQDLAQAPAFSDNASRVANRAALDARIAERLRTITRSQALALMQQAEIPAGPIYTVGEALQDLHVRTAGLVEHYHHPELGPVECLPQGVLLDGEPPTHRPPPLLGQHTDEVLRDYGCSQKQVTEWLGQGLVSRAPA